MHKHDYVSLDEKLVANEKRILIVVLLTFITMIFEIIYGHISGSMALLADGWHMGSHVAALGLSWLVYRLARSEKLSKRFSFGTGKMIPLGGYTSALMLGAIAIFMIIESLERFMHPQNINFKTAIIVAVIGLVVNFISAVILWDKHDHDHGHSHDDHHHHDHDHNHKSALVHVIADAFTSVLAIIALLLGNYFNLIWCDPLMGVVGALVILKWAYSLSKTTAGELLDVPSKLISKDDIFKLFEKEKDIKILDFHYWRIAPKAHACEVIFSSDTQRGSYFYREKIQKRFDIEHLVVEEQLNIQ